MSEKSRGPKPSSVPTALVGPILEKLIKDRWPYSEEDVEASGGELRSPYAILAEKAGCDYSTVERIVLQTNEGVDFDLFDKILCAVGRPDVWRGELLDLFEELTLLEKCWRDGCSVAFVPRMGGPSGFQRYCSRRCRQMAHLTATGKVTDGAKRNLKRACRKGHKRTPENTSAKGACRICDREQQAAKRSTLTPEQREAKRAYHRAYYLRQKAAAA